MILVVPKSPPSPSLSLSLSLSLNRGFAFVVFNDSDAVDKVINEGPHIIDGKEIDYKKAIPHAIHQVRHEDGCCGCG